MIETKKINYQLRFLKQAKRLTLRVVNKDLIKVTAPLGLKKDYIEKFILEKSDWILKKQNLLQEQKSYQVKIQNGCHLPFLGKNLILILNEGPKSTILDSEELKVTAPVDILASEKLNQLVLAWYQKEALRIIQERVRYFAELIGAKPKTIKIRNYKSRWGACSSKGDLIFNWQIVTFDPSSLDYVVAHEVCHLKEMNHSPRFYKMLTDLGFDKKEVKNKMRLYKNIF